VVDEVGVIVTLPWYVPAARFEPFALTVTEAGDAKVAVGDDDEALSQPVPSVIVTLVLKVISELLVATDNFCEAGATAPSVCENESDVGLTVITADVTVNDTGTVTGLPSTPVELMVIVLVYVLPGVTTNGFTPTRTPLGQEAGVRVAPNTVNHVSASGFATVKFN